MLYKMEKVLLLVFGFFAIIFIIAVIFNHVNAWLAFLVGGGLLYFYYRLIKKLTK